MSLIHCTEKDGIAMVKLNRPEVYNALNLATLEALSQQLNELHFDDTVRVVIITGAGEKAFCAGADLKERRSFSPEQVRYFVHLIRDTMNKIENLPKPVIAMINGYAFGGGAELALACDLRIASEQMQIGLTETSLGIIPGAGGTQRLPRLIGKTKAKEMIFTAQKMQATEALACGLVNQVVKRSELEEIAYQMAEQIKENAPLALKAAKFAIDLGMETNLSTGLALETKAYETLIPTEDRLEGLQAFKEKRKPQYRGR
ncbi:enoyl-CoA hydratase [Hazenella sp. IB182357]|uniref:Enoyl-CoA hydratase n=1 Tax=Polycladospora coralii TaxID=2771432 RepID=A0A926N9C6_9BACL|nr:enoyl-CoA hydratase [Polycladospora coralii]MBD1371305.1 enoyl-CoA hydratase [Polycladospora coralii]